MHCVGKLWIYASTAFVGFTSLELGSKTLFCVSCSLCQRTLGHFVLKCNSGPFALVLEARVYFIEALSATKSSLLVSRQLLLIMPIPVPVVTMTNKGNEAATDAPESLDPKPPKPET